jgi:hypothetical protein
LCARPKSLDAALVITVKDEVSGRTIETVEPFAVAAPSPAARGLERDSS